MSKPANKTLIGAFVIGAIALVVAGVVVFGSGKFFTKKTKFVMFFDSSVKGLAVGAPVVFKGVKMGEVTDIVLRFDPKDLSTLIPVYVEMDPSAITVPDSGFRIPGLEPGQYQYVKPLIEKGLKAQLQMQSFVTGLLMINLDFYPTYPAKYVGADTRYPEIPTIPTPLERLTKTIEDLHLEEIADKVKSMIGGMDTLVNSPELLASIKSLNQTLQSIDKLVKDVNAQVEPTVTDVRRLVNNVNTQVEPLASSIKTTSNAAGTAFVQAEKALRFDEGEPGQIAASVKETLATARTTLQKTQEAVEGVQRIAEQNANVGYEINRTLEDISSLARALRALSDYIDRHPDSFIKGKNP